MAGAAFFAAFGKRENAVMSRIELLPASYGSYKANLHCHTTLSDGRLTPKRSKARYLANGYSVVAFTDHNVLVDHSDLTDERFLALTGIEVDTDSFLYGRKHDFNQTCHLCAILRDPARPCAHLPRRAVHGRGHPRRWTSSTVAATSSTTTIPPGRPRGRTRFLTYGDFDGMEIYNHSAELENNNGNSQNECIPSRFACSSAHPHDRRRR